ncbi:MAG TPA: helix-turn-helix transcriptional regulator, partial [Candidatus Limnocylindrales bacterium]|nr:helix-turn-helix transcriptional regulator [Candidatus Limnocylindrales bacterium]
AARHAVDVADRLGAALRDARRKAGLTQADAARKAGISQSLWSQLESARSTGWTLLTWDRAAHAVGASFEAFIRGASAADQPRDIAHLKAQELVIRTSRAGLWASLPEQNIDRDARSSRAADVLLHRHIPPRPPEYGLMEVFDWFPDVGDPMRAWSSRLDAVERLAIARMGDDLPQVGGCWIVRATQRNRQLFNELAGIFTARFPGDPNAWLRALADPGSRMPKDAALLWVSVSGDRLFSRP